MTQRATRRALESLLEDYATQLDSVTAVHEVPGRTWRRGSMAFASIGPAGVELRLSPRVAAAAVATPDTEPSARGPEWVSFRPPELDEHALDRLEAWFELAWRHAAPTS